MTQSEREFLENLDIGGKRLQDLPGFEQPGFKEMCFEFLAAYGMTSPEGLRAAEGMPTDSPSAISVRAIHEKTKIPTNFLTVGYDNDYAPQWVEAASKFLGLAYAGHPMSIWIGGPTGRGKSHLAAMIARQLFDAGRATLWLNVPIFFDLVMDGFEHKTSKVEAAELKSKASSVPVLVLDDIGKYNTYSDGRTMSYMINQLYRIIEGRRDGRLTIYTSEFPSTGADLESRLSGAIVGRINENLIRAGVPPASSYRDFMKAKGHELPFEEIVGKVG